MSATNVLSSNVSQYKQYMNELRSSPQEEDALSF